jgi:hypothetical protein
MEPDGVLLYLKSAIYESGDSCLAAWLPRDDGAVASLQDLLSSAITGSQGDDGSESSIAALDVEMED